MVLITSFIATFCAAVFFGAAIYISIVQHPAALNTGGLVPGRFFSPMYHRAAPMQASLAIIGSIAAIIRWSISSGWLWLVGGLFLFAVIPFTFIWMKSVNDQLKESNRDPESTETLDLLNRWGQLHWIRSIMGGLAFLTFLIQLTLRLPKY